MKQRRINLWALVLAMVLSPVLARAQTALSNLDALRYIASHPDLIAAFGADASKGRGHYDALGVKEGRKITFEPLYYTASHPDLISAFRSDELKSVTHYIQWGYKEKRQVTWSALVALRYIASHPDLIAVFGADASKGVRHYVDWGYSEGRQITFDPLRYTASHPDLMDAFGADETKAVTHYLQWGYKEQRQTTLSELDALRYIASYGDLIANFAIDVAAGIRHYVSWGYREGRRILFDALGYIASHSDLIEAFGSDAVAGVKHYIDWGYKEARQITFDALGYMSRHTDLQQAFGTDTAAATRHFINWGFKEGRDSAFAVKVLTSGGGSVASDLLYVNAGDRATIVLKPDDGNYVSSATGCGGALSGSIYVTEPISSRCAVAVSFSLARVIEFTLTDVPATSYKVVAVVDNGGGKAITQVFAHSGSGTVAGRIALPVGSGYRLRVIALGGGGTFPSVLAGGKQEGITVTSGAPARVDISLNRPSLTVDPATPNQVVSGNAFTITLNISDPADFLDGAGNGRLWWGDQPRSLNVSGIQTGGTIQKLGAGQYRFSVNLTAPAVPGTIYYQFGESSRSFEDPAGNEAPFFVLPDLNIGQKLYEILVRY